MAKIQKEKRRLIIVSVFRPVFVVLFLHSTRCVCGYSRVSLHCFRKLCYTSVWSGTAICCALLVGDYAVTVCHGEVYSLGTIVCS